MIKFNPAQALGLFGDRSLLNLSRRVEQFENSLRRSHSRLQNVVLFAQILNWTEEALSILDERRQHAQSHSVHYGVKWQKCLRSEIERDAFDRPSAEHATPAEPDH